MLLEKIQKLGHAYHLPENWLSERPHLFSPTIIDLPSQHAIAMQEAVRIISYIAVLPAFQKTALQTENPITQKNPGVLFSYDFHLTEEGPKLIEINTNAAGAFLIALLEEASGIPHALEKWSARLLEMFLAEWKMHHAERPLRTIAIVDHNPTAQYFYPEFLLFQHLFKAHQIDCLIADPTQLSMRNSDQLWVDKKPIDLIYNRLTDFSFSQPEHAVLQQACLENKTVITPHPYAYALYANKRNLVLLSDRDFLVRCGLDETAADTLQKVVLPAHLVDANNADAVWDTRKQYFFKPISGYAGKGVYRGKNITRHVWSEIVSGDYMAQTLAPPSEIEIAGEQRKVDLRAYVYDGEILGFGARIYQGQTTNFRTPGGGFAVVRVV